MVLSQSEGTTGDCLTPLLKAQSPSTQLRAVFGLNFSGEGGSSLSLHTVSSLVQACGQPPCENSVFFE